MSDGVGAGVSRLEGRGGEGGGVGGRRVAQKHQRG